MELPEFLYNTMYDRSKEDPTPKISPIHLDVLAELRLVTDTHRYRNIALYRAIIASRGK